MKARRSIDKPDTPFAPMLSSWLTDERWKVDVSAPISMSPEDLEAAKRRLQEQQRRHKVYMAELLSGRAWNYWVTTS